ncbi:MAG: DUF2157 domain-containing protein [Gammaproteobacteria bacterium]|nr:DUF2157 domain-containing protein [Gammaproteobacteria bacterium]
MSNHHQWLARQLPQWVDESIISPAQAEALRERYPLKDTINLGRLLLTGIAAVMIGLGVILLFAYNWSAMGKLSKLAVIFAFLGGAHVAALLLRTRSHVYSESLFALGTMLMGAGIFLVGQVYHMDSHYPNAFLFWSLGALALAWALPSLTQAFMAVALLMTWHLTEVLDFHAANHLALPLVLAIFPLAWRLRSPMLGRFASAVLFVTIGFSISVVESDLVVSMLLFTAMALLALEGLAGPAASEIQREIARAGAGPALLVMVVLMYMMSFGDFVPELIDIELQSGVAVAYFIAALVVSQGAFFWLLWRERLNALVRLAELALLLALLPSLLAYASGEESIRGGAGWVALGFNLTLLSLSVWLMVDGARNADRRHMVQGSLLFALLAAARYTDLFDSLIARALVFLLVGAALFAVSHFYQRNKGQVSREA